VGCARSSRRRLGMPTSCAVHRGSRRWKFDARSASRSHASIVSCLQAKIFSFMIPMQMRGVALFR
jgi:hypothetical protein